MITLTEAAVRQLQSLIAEKGEPDKGLRVFVEKGGCAGWQYGMTLDDPAAADAVIESGGVKVLVDPESASFLHGSTLDYADDLAGAGFRLNNPNATRSCGCGTSFEPAAADAEPARP
jgi:iron-sulfur cluster assembly accessory protein